MSGLSSTLYSAVREFLRTLVSFMHILQRHGLQGVGFPGIMSNE